MPLSLGSTLTTEVAKLHSTSSFVWLYEVQVDASNAFRLAAYPSNVVIYEGSASPYTARTFCASNVGQPEIAKDNKGSLDRVRVAVENVTLEVSTYLETNDLTAKRVRVLVVHSGHLGSTSSATQFVLSERYQILGYEANNTAVTFELGHWSLFGKRVPGHRYSRGRCRFQYQGTQCGASIEKNTTGMRDGFDLSLVDKDTCDLGYDTPNGCKAHGALEAQIGVPVIHPRRFGGFPGLVKGSGF